MAFKPLNFFLFEVLLGQYAMAVVAFTAKNLLRVFHTFHQNSGEGMGGAYKKGLHPLLPLPLPPSGPTRWQPWPFRACAEALVGRQLEVEAGGELRQQRHDLHVRQPRPQAHPRPEAERRAQELVVLRSRHGAPAEAAPAARANLAIP